MTTTSGKFRYFILGLLNHQPMSGYDIKRFLGSLGWLVGSPSFGVIYPALHTLLEDKWVTVEVLSQPNKPPRKIYTITPEGKRVLQEWMHRPVESNSSSKTFTMRLILADNLSRDGLIAHLEQRRLHVISQHTDLQKMTTELDLETDWGQHLAINYGMVIIGAELDWLDKMLAQLSIQESMEHVPDTI
jgi:PadR family transcriptional regulator AphA